MGTSFISSNGRQWRGHAESLEDWKAYCDLNLYPDTRAGIGAHHLNWRKPKPKRRGRWR